MTEINGTVADGFEPVRDAFEANFAEHGDVGAGFSLYVEGECVVDLTGGIADPATGRGLRRHDAAARLLDHQGRSRHLRPPAGPAR